MLVPTRGNGYSSERLRIHCIAEQGVALFTIVLTQVDESDRCRLFGRVV
jgi:hypothetical protein